MVNLTSLQGRNLAFLVSFGEFQDCHWNFKDKNEDSKLDYATIYLYSDGQTYI